MPSLPCWVGKVQTRCPNRSDAVLSREFGPNWLNTPAIYWDGGRYHCLQAVRDFTSSDPTSIIPYRYPFESPYYTGEYPIMIEKKQLSSRRKKNTLCPQYQNE